MKSPKYKARFVKSHNPDGTVNKYDSGWKVYINDGEVYTFTIRSIGCEKADADEVYQGLNSEKFGKALIRIVKAGLIPDFKPRTLPIS